MPIFGLFRKSKKEEELKMEENQSSPPESTSQPLTPEPVQEPAPEPAQSETVETKPTETQIYLRAMPLRDLADLDTIKAEVSKGNIIILKITPLANKSIQDVSKAVNVLYEFAESIGGDIARLGEERIVICPPKIKIWREKAPVQSEPVPTAA